MSFGSLSSGQLGQKDAPKIAAPLQEVMAMLKAMIATPIESTEEADPTRYWIHPSNLPYCGLHDWYTQTPVQTDCSSDVRSSLFMGYGTVMHETLQEFLAHFLQPKSKLIPGVKLLGLWECECGYTTRKISTRPECCPKCKLPLFYREVRVSKFDDDNLLLYGKIDLILEINGQLVVIDFKTTSGQNIYRYNQGKGGLPANEAVWQVKTYASLLEKKLKRKVAYWALVYIDRDPRFLALAVIGDPVTDILREEMMGHLEKWYAAIRLVKAYFLDPHKFEYKDIIPGLIETKWCRNKTHYKETFKSPYRECALGESGECFKTQKLRKVCKVEWKQRS